MKIKANDTVVVISGKDKGKKGKVIKAMPKENKVIVEGVNMQTKHAKQTRTTPAELKHQEGTIDVSHEMYWDSKTKSGTRIGYQGQGKNKVRISKKSGEKID